MNLIPSSVPSSLHQFGQTKQHFESVTSSVKWTRYCIGGVAAVKIIKGHIERVIAQSFGEYARVDK